MKNGPIKLIGLKYVKGSCCSDEHALTMMDIRMMMITMMILTILTMTILFTMIIRTNLGIDVLLLIATPETNTSNMLRSRLQIVCSQWIILQPNALMHIDFSANISLSGNLSG